MDWQWTGFYMTTTSVMNELIRFLIDIQLNSNKSNFFISVFVTE